MYSLATFRMSHVQHMKEVMSHVCVSLQVDFCGVVFVFLRSCSVTMFRMSHVMSHLCQFPLKIWAFFSAPCWENAEQLHHVYYELSRLNL